MIMWLQTLQSGNASPVRTVANGRRLVRWLKLSVLTGASLALCGCAFPRKDFSSVPDPRVITVKQDGPGYVAFAPDCERLLQPSQHNKADDLRMSIAFGCATYTNLAGQLARPEDLVRAKSYGGQSAETAAGAIERYSQNKVTPLRETMSTDVGRQQR
jgi:hypothetical protein